MQQQVKMNLVGCVAELPVIRSMVRSIGLNSRRLARKCHASASIVLVCPMLSLCITAHGVLGETLIKFQTAINSVMTVMTTYSHDTGKSQAEGVRISTGVGDIFDVNG